MCHKLPALFLAMLAASSSVHVHAQLSVSFQRGVNDYAGAVDNEFRAAAAFETQGAKDFVSIDEFDGGFQTQGALRFENLFGNQIGQVPPAVSIAFATLTIYVTSSSDVDAILGFHRVLPASPWDETSTWFSLGGDTFTDPDTGLIVNDAILQNDIESLAIPDGIVPTPNLSGTFVDVDVTTSVAAWYAGAANLGWGINNSTGNGWDFRSSEYATIEFRPKLTIGYQLKKGDLDFDNDVDLLDYQLLLDNLGVHLDSPILQGATGDLDFDRDVDLDDFGVFKGVYPGGVAALEAALRAVPEPGSSVLFAISLGAMAGLRGRFATKG